MLPSTRRVLLVLAPLLVAPPPWCHAQQPTRVPRPEKALVPNWPPDYVPDSIWDAVHAPKNMEQSAPEWATPFPRNIVLVGFRDHATHQQKQEAIDAINGVVVGGIPISKGGAYYVRIPDDGTSRPLFRAIKKLRSFPQVELATPELPPLDYR